MSVLPAWLDHRTSRAPAALGARVRAYALAQPYPPAQASIAPTLARAAREALGGVLGQAGDRSAALDLLAADALITLALLAQAEQAPERLGELATALLRAESRTP